MFSCINIIKYNKINFWNGSQQKGKFHRCLGRERRGRPDLEDTQRNLHAALPRRLRTHPKQSSTRSDAGVELERTTRKFRKFATAHVWGGGVLENNRINSFPSNADGVLLTCVTRTVCTASESHLSTICCRVGPFFIVLWAFSKYPNNK